MFRQARFPPEAWGMNRVLLPTAADPVAPGQSVTFSFNVTAPATAGTYNFQWQTVLDGVEFFGDLAPNVAVKVGLNDAAFVSQSVPTVMVPGQTYAVSVTMQNTGGTTWTSATNYKLGSVNPFNNTTWGMNRVLLPNANPVAPGQSVTFSFNVTAPATPGTYNFQWRTVLDGIEFFGDVAPNVAVKVGLDNAAFVSQSVPATMAPGSVYPVSVTMQNTGSTTWSPGSVSLGSQNPADNTTWGLSRVALPNSVAPGASVTFSFNVTAPATAGPYNFQWRVLEGAFSWFGAPTQNASIVVGASTPLAGLHFIHVDHLNTPRLIANASGQAVWRWDQQEPFGVSPPDKNPSGLGVFDFPLRFAGQYDDPETGLFYNYFRDCYDPVLGRYCQSDPIGLRGGINTYGYVHGNPVSFNDPTGELVPVLLAPVLLATGASTTTSVLTIAGLAALVGIATTADPLTNSAANDPQFAGGDECPPECKKLWEQLEALYQRITKMQASADPFIRGRAQSFGQQFRQLVKQYNQKCTPKWTKDPFLSSVKPTPTRDMIDDFYSR